MSEHYEVLLYSTRCYDRTSERRLCAAARNLPLLRARIAAWLMVPGMAAFVWRVRPAFGRRGAKRRQVWSGVSGDRVPYSWQMRDRLV